MSIERYGKTRSYFLWLILGIFTAGIANAIYYYLNFVDLQDHYQRYGPHDNAPVTDVSPGLMVLLCLGSYIIPFLSLIPLYQKYSILHDHVKMSGARRNIPDGVSAILQLFCLGILTLGIYYVYLEWKWQDIYNKHVEWHAYRGQQAAGTR